MFHRKGNAIVSPPPAPQFAAPQAYPWYPPMPPLGFGMPGFPGYPQTPAAPAAPAPALAPMPSSDPADDSGVMYPSITTFIETLIARVPQRHGLREVADTLDSLHFYEINE